MNIKQRTLQMMEERQKILFLNHKDYKYIEHISTYKPGRATATIIHATDVLFVVYNWAAKNISDAIHDSPLKLNADLFAEHQTLSPSVGAAVIEHLMECNRADADVKGFMEEKWIGRNVPSKIIYCGTNWAGGMAFLQALVTPPDCLVTVDAPEFSKACTKYLRDKVRGRCGQFTFYNINTEE